MSLPAQRLNMTVSAVPPVLYCTVLYLHAAHTDAVLLNWHNIKIFSFLVDQKMCLKKSKNFNFKSDIKMVLNNLFFVSHHHHHKYPGLDPLISSVSRVTAVRANASSVFQLFSFLVVCSAMISKGFGFVAFFASVKASSVCIHLYCLVCL